MTLCKQNYENSCKTNTGNQYKKRKAQLNKTPFEKKSILKYQPSQRFGNDSCPG